MKKIILTFGIIAGLIVCSMFYLTNSGGIDFDKGMIYGYVSMVIALSSIFFATKQFRDKYLNGAINFGKSFQIGIGITLVTTLIYVLFWEVYFKYMAADFPEQYVSYISESMEAEGKTALEIESALKPIQESMEEYKTNRPFRMMLTSIEILPVGLIITLISSVLFGVILRSDLKK